MSYTSIGTNYMKKAKKNTKKIDVFALMVKHMSDKTPVKQNSGRGVIADSTVSRIQDIYNEGKKENE
ncbi:hypothetical protein [uncultured Mediterranean phage uvMED]|nr:hypothetical protein [uncultured Mediterranean phage uvMED]